MRLSNFNYFLVILLFLVVMLSFKKSFSQEPDRKTAAPPHSAPVESPKVTTKSIKMPVAPAKPAPDVTKADVAPITQKPAAKDLVVDDQLSKETKHEVIRRVVVFPFNTNNDFRQEADLAWWKVREFLSDQQRFLVATKRFMQQKEVDQPRKALTIADTVFLAKTLDSDCLITTYIDNRALNMQAYSAIDGQLLWKNSLDFSPAKPISTQLESTSQKLIKDFLASIPYQGFQIVDPLNPKALTEEGETIMAKVDVGAKSSATQGQKAQWVEINRTSTAPLFQGGAQIRVIAEGEVLANENQVLTVEVKRAKDLKYLDKKSLVLIPEESKKLYNLYSLRKSDDNMEPNLNLLSEPLQDAREKNEESRPLLVALTAIGNIVAAVLLAF